MPVTVRTSWGAVSPTGQPGSGDITYSKQYRLRARAAVAFGAYGNGSAHGKDALNDDDSVAWGSTYQARVKAQRTGATDSPYTEGNQIAANHAPQYASATHSVTVTAAATSASDLGLAATDADVSDGDKISYRITEIRQRVNGAPSGTVVADSGFTVGSDGLVDYSGSALSDGDIWEIDVQATDLLGAFAEYSLHVNVGASAGNPPTWVRNQNFDVAVGTSRTIDLRSYSSDGDGGEATSFTLTNTSDFTPLSGVTVALSDAGNRTLTVTASASAEPGSYNIGIRATDDDGSTNTSGWTITVVSALRAPTFVRTQVV